MTDQELFDPKRIAARQAEAAAELARGTALTSDPESPEAVSVAATLVANGFRAVPSFTGTYPHHGGRKVAGFMAPPPPGDSG